MEQYVRESIYVGDLTPGQVAALEQVVAAYRGVTSRGRRSNIVYVMRHEPSGIVKIGCTNDLDRRRRELMAVGGGLPRGFEPGPMHLVAAKRVDDGMRTERDLHHRFRHLRIAGSREWYRAGSDLLDYAAQIDALPGEQTSLWPTPGVRSTVVT